MCVGDGRRTSFSANAPDTKKSILLRYRNAFAASRSPMSVDILYIQGISYVYLFVLYLFCLRPTLHNHRRCMRKYVRAFVARHNERTRNGVLSIVKYFHESYDRTQNFVLRVNPLRPLSRQPSIRHDSELLKPFFLFVFRFLSC